MTISLRWTAAAALLAAAACQGGENATSAPWLTYPGVDGHAKYLPLAGTSHDPSAAATTVTCTGCHTDPSTFRTFDCISCHNHSDQTALTALHPGVAFVYTSQACYDCHRNGIAAPADHNTRFFPQGAGTAHAGIGCAQCHTDLANPNDPHNFACASCHVAAAPPLPSPFPPHGTVNIPGGVGVLAVAILTVHTSQNTTTSLTLTSENCLRCHADSQVDRVASHPGGDSGLGNNNHQDAGCTTCHNAFRSDKPFAASFGWTSGPSRSSPGCITCHATIPIGP